VNIFPAIDLKDNKCVRLTKGAEQSAIVYNQNPLEQAKFFEKQGCERLHIVDLDAAFGRPEVNKTTIINIRNSIDIPIQLGGGIRSEVVLKNYINAGIDFLIIGSFAVQNPELVATISKKYLERIYFALDVLDKKIMIKGWEDQSNLTNVDVFQHFNNTDIKGYVLTDVSRDGMMKGLDIALIKENLTLSKKNLIVGGGLSSYEDIEELCKLKSKKIEGVIVGKSFYEGNINIKEAMDILKQNA
tara:strand:- start:297 stop:1028 length:732 start_codon:yes stop_codon:yes gene_type:complete